MSGDSILNTQIDQTQVFIRIGEDDFELQAHYDKLRGFQQAGAVVGFVGLVRDYGDLQQVQALELECYPAMAQAQLLDLCQQACKRWPLLGIEVVHRVGRLELDEQIVLVAVASSHRDAAFACASFIMDCLKQSVPIWKKEISQGQASWVEAKQTDLNKADEWLK